MNDDLPYLMITIAELAQASGTPARLWGADPDGSVLVYSDGSVAPIMGKPSKELARGNNPIVQAKLRKWFPERVVAELTAQRAAYAAENIVLAKALASVAASRGKLNLICEETARLQRAGDFVIDRSIMTGIPR